MRQKGLSRVEVAYKTGVGEATVYRWTSGRTGIPDDRKLALSKLFEVPVPYLMGWDDSLDGAA